MLLLADLVERGAHQAEILLRGIGAAEALGRCAIGDIVQQRLTRGTDDGDDVRALLCARLGLDNILIDIAGRDDDVQIRAFLVTELLEILVAAADILVDALDGRVHDRGDGGADLLVGVGGNLGQIQLTPVDGLSHGLGIHTGFDHGVADGPRRANGEEGRGHHVINNDVGQRDVHVVDTVDAQQAADRALHRDGGVLVNEALGVVRHIRGGGTGLIDQIKIQAEFAFHSIPLISSRGARCAAAWWARDSAAACPRRPMQHRSFRPSSCRCRRRSGSSGHSAQAAYRR